jgi:hypothetical protein
MTKQIKKEKENQGFVGKERILPCTNISKMFVEFYPPYFLSGQQ